MKLSPPELVCAGVDAAELVGCAEAVAETFGIAAAEWVWVGEGADVVPDPGVAVSKDVGASPMVPVKDVGDASAAGADEAAGGGGFDPVAAHAVRQAPPMTAAMIAAGTRDILMPFLLRLVTR